MGLGEARRGNQKKRSIFRSLFIPLFLIMLLQAAIFYFAAVYGGIEESLNQNAADILTERLLNQKNELEAQFNNRSFSLDACARRLAEQYEALEAAAGAKPLTESPERQVRFLGDCADILVDTLRQNEANGVFLILNDQPDRNAPAQAGPEKKYGLCIRDIDQNSNYTAREDLLLERSPSSIVDSLGCTLDSWWEAYYTFDSEAQGDYYYKPLNAAWTHPGANGGDLAYFSGVHRVSGSDQTVVSYSIPLTDEDGYPYGVVGVELTTKYLASLLPNNGLDDMSKPCYVLAMRQVGSDECEPIVGAGALYMRSFGQDSVLSCADTAAMGGFYAVGRGDIRLYGDSAPITVYNNNNPFEDRELVLLAMAEKGALFAHISRVKVTLMIVSLFCLMLGLLAIWLVSRRFAAPITALADRVRDLKPRAGFHLGRLGIVEIDQLVASIETLNRDVSRSSARTEFFSRMSHDMRTPMNAIISFSSPDMLEGEGEAFKDECLRKINDSGTYLLGLINEVLDMTKIESDKVELRYETVAASRLCETTIPIIEKLASRKRVDFVSENTAAPGLFVMTDVLHLNQIVMNLLSNAVKFTPAGGQVRFLVALEQDAQDPQTVRCRIVVSDNGIGMSEAFMKDLFTPFEQENEAYEGTGLGLSIAKKLTEMMGGSIACQSKLNVGTTFTVDLPLKRQKEGVSEIPSASTDRAKREALRGKRILLCEDYSINIQIMCHLLSKTGMETDVAQNGRIGLKMFAASAPNTYDAILMDVRMPVMDGLDAARAIRALNRPDAATVPIIAITANAFDEDVQESAAAGMNAHLAKPIETAKFFDLLYRFTCRRADKPQGSR